MQGLSAIRSTRREDVRSPATAPTRARPRAGHTLLAGTVPESHTTFSLLPDCLAARLPGELDTLEAVVAHAEQAPSLGVPQASGFPFVDRQLQSRHEPLDRRQHLCRRRLAEHTQVVGIVRACQKIGIYLNPKNKWRFKILITTQAKRNLSSRSGIGGVLSAT